MKKVIALLLVFTLILANLLVLAETTDQQVIAKEIAGQVMSPFCPGRALSDCPSRKADQLKKEILEKLNLGQTKEEVINGILNEYGEEYNALPSWQGREALAWWMPIGFFLFFVAAILIWFSLQK